MSSFCSLYINSSSDTWLANILSHSVGCLFSFWWFLLQCRNSLVCSLLCFCFIASAFSVRARRPMPRPMSRSLMVSGLICKSLINLVLIFVCWHKIVVQCHFFACGNPALPTPFLKRLSFPHWLFLAPLSNIRWLYTCGFIPGILLVIHWSVCVFI